MAMEQEFERLTGHPPLRWQRRLYSDLAVGKIPAACDLPTGTGKTSVIALWYLARKSGARLPRRLVYIVDRRAVVDQATEVAQRIQANAVDPDLHISTLRGQQQDNARWRDDPSGLAIIVGTVDMIGSRLLFSGYGVSRKMAPMHAGLLGADTLFVLDEAHLVPPFQHFLKTIVAGAKEFGAAAAADQGLIPTASFLPLSATGRDHGNEAFRLQPEDHEDQFISLVVNAVKHVTVTKLSEKQKLADALASRALTVAAAHTGSRIAVFCDKRKDADEVSKRLAKSPSVLLSGARRVREREQASRGLASLGFLAAPEPHAATAGATAFLVATAAGEVGIDIDADHMVCDLVAWERMVQRFGRVNRRGGQNREAEIAVIDQGPAPAGKGQTDEQNRALAQHDATVRLLEQAADASPAALRELNAKFPDLVTTATTPEPLRPRLTRALIDAWSLTSLEEHPGRPEVDPWLRGWTKSEPQTVVAWRQYLPAPENGGIARKADLVNFFRTAPPHLSERLETETWVVLDWLAARAKIAPSDRFAAFVLKRGEITRLSAADLQDPKRKDYLMGHLAGATLVVPSGLGGLSPAGLLDKGENNPAPAADVTNPDDWLGYTVDGDPRVPFRVRFRDAEAEPGFGWTERARFVTRFDADGAASAWLSVEKWGTDSADDDDAAEGHPQLLECHIAAVERHLKRLTARLAIPPDLAAALHLAARLHDEGKRSPRWQRAFRAPRDGRIYGKTPGPIDFALLDHYRHELGSLLVIEGTAEIQQLPEEHRDLVLHLIAAHHGWARPLIGTSGCDGKPPSALAETARDIALRFARLQKQWGPWGLAWLETLLRSADQAASRENDASKTGNQKAAGAN